MDAGSRGNGNVTEWQRDAAERVTKEVQADGTFETHAYDFSGRLVATVDPMGRAMTLEHALDNRVTQSALARRTREPGRKTLTVPPSHLVRAVALPRRRAASPPSPTQARRVAP